jgi:hypothetical protein
MPVEYAVTIGRTKLDIIVWSFKKSQAGARHGAEYLQVIPALWRLRQEDHEFKAMGLHTETHVSKKPKEPR